MKQKRISPEDILFEEGDTEDQSLYFIAKGKIQIYINAYKDAD